MYDILVIGGGINGTAVARDAAGRGLSVLLCERDDLAEHTSSASTKLIHGGLRYLEQYEFRLVRDALREREVLLRAAPHIIWPMRFVLPHDDGLRPKWMLRMGLFLYDHLGGREELEGTRTVDLHEGVHAGLLEPRLKTGFEYSDCWVEDARLVVLNAVDARERGADVLTRTEVRTLAADADGFVAGLSDGRTARARACVNAAGPWVDAVLGKAKTVANDASVRLVKGSHIVLPRLFDHDDAYIFQNGDGRVVFAIPYETDYTLIGTTDVPYSPDDGKPEASPEEVKYLCDATNEYFAKDIAPDDVAWTYSGVRPLYDDKSEDASAVTRDYVLDIDHVHGHPLLSVYGGKITTSRKLGEHAVGKLEETFGGLMGPPWTRDAHLPGGDMKGSGVEAFTAFFADMQARYPNLERGVLHRLCRHYGSLTPSIIARGDTLLPGKLLEGEVHHLVDTEWVTRPEDILWRRTKRGLHMSDEEIAEFGDAFERLVGDRVRAA